jgi:hypothetical protein
MGTAAPISEAHLETTSTRHSFVLDETDGHDVIETRRRRESNCRLHPSIAPLFSPRADARLAKFRKYELDASLGKYALNGFQTHFE